MSGRSRPDDEIALWRLKANRKMGQSKMINVLHPICMTTLSNGIWKWRWFTIKTAQPCPSGWFLSHHVRHLLFVELRHFHSECSCQFCSFDNAKKKQPNLCDSPHPHHWPTSWCAGRIAHSWYHTPGRFPEERCLKTNRWEPVHFWVKSWKQYHDSCKKSRPPLRKLAASTNNLFYIVSHRLNEKSAELLNRNRTTFIRQFLVNGQFNFSKGMVHTQPCVSVDGCVWQTSSSLTCQCWDIK